MPHVVLVDDNSTTQRVFELCLADEEIRVTSFSQPAEALEFIRTHPIDQVYAHVLQPDGDGYELSRQLKSDPASKDLTVVLLVGAFQAFDEERARDAGCLHHLAKPFETSGLLQLVNELLENPPRLDLTAAETVEPSSFLFTIPLGSATGEVVFELSAQQCRPSVEALKREIVLPDVPAVASETATGGPFPRDAV